jgi:hypothetical protein
MTSILRDLPFSEQRDELAIGLHRIPIKPYQIVIWVSLTTRGILELPPHAPRFPMILDTGHNYNFSIREETDKGVLRSMRRFLTEAGVTP